MKRLVLALLLVGLASQLIPPLRERAQPQIDAGREWLGEKLEGPMTPVLTPFRRIKTETKLGDVGRLLVQERNRGQQPPRPDRFREYLRERNLDSLDAWGSLLVLDQQPDSVAVISAGPDLEYDTEDDVVRRVRYRAPDRFRRRR